MDIIYKINFTNNNVCYIGKLDSTDVIQDHCKWYCTNSSTHQSTWEYIWEKEVNQTGLIHQTFVYSYQYWDIEQVKNQLFKSGLTPDVYNSLKLAWGKTDKETCEALCIILAQKDGRSIGQKVDFLDSQTNVLNYFSESEILGRMKRQFDQYKLMSGLFLNFSKRKAPAVDELNEYIVDLYKKATNAKGATLVTKSKRLAEAIALRITEHTIDDLVKQLYYRAKKEPFLQQYIENIADEMKNAAYTSSGNLKSITYGELFTHIYDYIDKNNATQLEILTDKVTPSGLSAFMQSWLQHTYLSTILPQRTGTYVRFSDDKFVQETAKKRFSNYIQRICFSEAPNEQYQSWKMDQLSSPENNLYFKPGVLYLQFIQNYNERSLRQKTEDKIKTIAPPFVSNYWSQIYPEQVAIFLTNNGYAFPYGRLSHGFISNLEVQDIQWY